MMLAEVPKVIIPEGATHYRVLKSARTSMGVFVVYYKFYKQQEDGQWLVYFSDCDNEYPYWRLVSQTYKSFNPETAITPLIVV